MSLSDTMGYTLLMRPKEVRKSFIIGMLVYVLHVVNAMCTDVGVLQLANAVTPFIDLTTAESFLEKAIYSLCKTREELANDFHCDLDRFPEVGFPFYMHDFKSEAPNQKPSVQFVPEFANGVYGENESEGNNIIKRLQKSFKKWQPQKGIQTCPVGVLTGASATGKTRAAYEFGAEMGIPIIIKIYENEFKKVWEAFYVTLKGEHRQAPTKQSSMLCRNAYAPIYNGQCTS